MASAANSMKKLRNKSKQYLNQRYNLSKNLLREGQKDEKETRV